MVALSALRAIAPIILGIMIGVVSANIYGSFVTIPAAREAGVQSERAVWRELQRQAEEAAEEDRRVAQARIDAIERNFHQREAERLAQLSNLEAAIEQEISRVPIPSSANRGAVACRPAVPRGLRDALDAIGRATPRSNSPNASDAVR